MLVFLSKVLALAFLLSLVLVVLYYLSLEQIRSILPPTNSEVGYSLNLFLTSSPCSLEGICHMVQTLLSSFCLSQILPQT
jgi:hypothetical protein